MPIIETKHETELSEFEVEALEAEAGLEIEDLDSEFFSDEPEGLNVEPFVKVLQEDLYETTED